MIHIKILKIIFFISSNSKGLCFKSKLILLLLISSYFFIALSNIVSTSLLFGTIGLVLKVISIIADSIIKDLFLTILLIILSFG